MNRITIRYHKSPCGELILGAFDGRLCLCDWRYRKMRTTVDGRIQRLLDAVYEEGNDRTLDMAIAELKQYFNGTRREFTVPLLPAGSDFQRRVWEALGRIPFGATVSYRQLAEQVGDRKAVRAVAAANGANALSLFLPCHRVVGADGRLVGYAGGLNAKRRLLELEREPFILAPSPAGTV